MSGLGVQVDRLTCVYTSDDERMVALDDVSFAVPAGATAAIVGPSGSGKSTLLAVLAGLHRPTSGTVDIGGLEITALPQRRLTALRRDLLAVVVQDARRNLIAYGTATDNVRFAQGALRRSTRRNPEALLQLVGLGHVLDVPVERLSGGERQRAAIAAGLATDPRVLLVDEPTSALDPRSRDDVVALLLDASTRMGTTLLVITHHQEVAGRFGAQIVLDGGRRVDAP